MLVWALKLIPVSMLVFLNSDLLKYQLVESTLQVNTGYIQCYFLTLIRDYAV